MGDSGKHRLFVFSKLESFAKARDEVNKLLKECLRERPDVDVTDYHGSAVGVGKKYKTITAAVVIDKRQTRCLITPSRRDRNVDHWDELRTLYRQTIPHGSILLFIYGDDWSKDEDTMVSKKWFDIWRYNDTTAYELAFRSRCFTLDKKLNEKHRETLERYFSVVEKLAPGGEKNCKLKVSVAGNDERVSLNAYLKTHPFLTSQSPDDAATIEYKSVFPPEVTGKSLTRITERQFVF
ncbi:uncharacterized protein [Ptychodera flava]|uniref:uncharacterized protein n=1 Tax=Ptychodera flava TaxID=63121 RepID=UPI00396A996A